MTGARLGHAQLVISNLSHTDLSGVDLTSASLSGAKITKANFAGAAWTCRLRPDDQFGPYPRVAL